MRQIFISTCPKRWSDSLCDSLSRRAIRSRQNDTECGANGGGTSTMARPTFEHVNFSWIYNCVSEFAGHWCVRGTWEREAHIVITTWLFHFANKMQTSHARNAKERIVNAPQWSHKHILLLPFSIARLNFSVCVFGVYVQINVSPVFSKEYTRRSRKQIQQNTEEKKK